MSGPAKFLYPRCSILEHLAVSLIQRTPIARRIYLLSLTTHPPEVETNRSISSHRPLLGVDRVEVPSSDTSREIQVGQMLGKTLCGKTGETPDQGEVFEKSGSGTSFTIGRLLTWNGWVGFFFVQYSGITERFHEFKKVTFRKTFNLPNGFLSGKRKLGWARIEAPEAREK